MKKELFLNYINYLTDPIYRDRDQGSHYVSLNFGTGISTYYDVFLKTDSDNNTYFETSLPLNFKGPQDPVLVNNKLHPEDFLHHISKSHLGYNLDGLLLQLEEKVIVRAVVHKKAVLEFKDLFPDIDLEKAFEQFDAFGKALVNAVNEVVRDKRKASFKVIDGDL